MKKFILSIAGICLASLVMAQSYVGSGDTYPTREKLVLKHLAITEDIVLPAGAINTNALPANIPAKNLTNALATAGAAIGGNLSVSTVTNLLVGTAYTTNTFTGDGVTNVVIWRTIGTAKVLHSFTQTP